MQAVSSFRKEGDISRGPSVRTGGMPASQAGTATKEGVTNQCIQNAGFAVIISISGHRVRTDAMAEFSIKNRSRNVMREKDGLCQYADLINAICALPGHQTAFQARKRLPEDFAVGGSLASLSLGIEKLGMHLDLRRVKVTETRSFQEMPLVLDCAFLVRCFCGSHPDHRGFVDTKTGIVPDSCKRYPLLLTTKSLLLCMGADPKCSRSAEVRELGDAPLPKQGPNIKRTSLFSNYI